jgi:hypothetical protein
MFLRFKDDNIIERSSRISWSEDRSKHILAIRKASLEDAGRYTARFTNVAGETATSAGLVVLGEFPVISSRSPSNSRYVVTVSWKKKSDAQRNKLTAELEPAARFMNE